MTRTCIRYRSGYKYQLAEDYEIFLELYPEKDIETLFISLKTDGRLTIWKGYAWDGPSGPVIDTPNAMRGSLVHDALYQLMRGKYLSTRIHRQAADTIFKEICIQDGMSVARARIHFLGLQVGGKAAASPKNKKKVHTAPRNIT